MFFKRKKDKLKERYIRRCRAEIAEQERERLDCSFTDFYSKYFVQYEINEREPSYSLGMLQLYVNALYSKHGRGRYTFQIWGLHKPCLETAEQTLYIDVFNADKNIKVAQFKLGDIRRRENGEAGI